LSAEGLLPVWTVAKEWHRSASELYKEIEELDYREEQGVFFRHRPRRAWRINRFQYIYWRRLPADAASDSQVKQFSDFLLQHLEPAITALIETRRFLLAQREAAFVRLEHREQMATNHHQEPEEEKT
jgi:hypothetical protein